MIMMHKQLVLSGSSGRTTKGRRHTMEDSPGRSQIVMPNPDDRPPKSPEFSRHRLIPGAISHELRVPIFGIRFRSDRASRTGVPEASIYKNRDAFATEDKVGFAVHRLPSPPPADARFAKETNNCQLRRMVSMRSDGCHHSGSLRLGEGIRHCLLANVAHRGPAAWSRCNVAIPDRLRIIAIEPSMTSRKGTGSQIL